MPQIEGFLFAAKPSNLASRFAWLLAIVCFLVCFLWLHPVHAGHSRSCYLDAGQSSNGRYLVTAKREDTINKKGQRIDYRWTFTWLDQQKGETQKGELLGLRSGADNVFDPVNAHIFVAPDGETFALWMPQSMARSNEKKPSVEDRGTSEYHDFAGFDHRLTIYKKNGEVIKRLGVKDFFHNNDWQWIHFHGCQVYWLVEFENLDTRRTPRSGHALFRISPDYTILEFQIGANQEAAHKAKQRGITPPATRVVCVRLSDGKIIAKEELVDSRKIPVRPFVGELADKEHPQWSYTPSLDPVRTPGRFVERDRTELPIRLGLSTPTVETEVDEQ